VRDQLPDRHGMVGVHQHRTVGSAGAAALRLASPVPGALPFSSILSRSPNMFVFSAFALLYFFACSVSHVRWQRGQQVGIVRRESVRQKVRPRRNGSEGGCVEGRRRYSVLCRPRLMRSAVHEPRPTEYPYGAMGMFSKRWSSRELPFTR
jgi:hypothetical protein